MANELKLKIIDTNIDGMNGIRSFRVQVLEFDGDGKETGLSSPVQDFSIDADALRIRHGNDYLQYLRDEVKPRMLEFYKNHQAANMAAPGKDELV